MTNKAFDLQYNIDIVYICLSFENIFIGQQIFSVPYLDCVWIEITLRKRHLFLLTAVVNMFEE